MSDKAELDTTTNRSVYRKAYKRHICKSEGLCWFCGWHSGENRRRTSTHGARKPRRKDHR